MVVHTCYPGTQRPRHECHEFKASLGRVARSCFKKYIFFKKLEFQILCGNVNFFTN